MVSGIKWIYRGITRQQGVLSFAVYLQLNQIEVLKGMNSSGEKLMKIINDRVSYLQLQTNGELKLTRFSWEKPGHKSTVHGQIRFECRSKQPDSDVILLLKLRQFVRKNVVETTGISFHRVDADQKRELQLTAKLKRNDNSSGAYPST